MAVKKRTQRGHDIREFLIESIPDHPRDVVRIAGHRFDISRQAVIRYVRDLIREGYIVAKGNTRSRAYSLRLMEEKHLARPLRDLDEDKLWRDELTPVLGHLPENVRSVWHYAFTEMVNNAIDHSEGRELTIDVEINALVAEIRLCDDGIGIFSKIRSQCQLEDERHAVLELAKGKLTTDPDRHTGEGIFFTSRMLDDFGILSGEVYFSHKHEENEDWVMERDLPQTGTCVFMELSNRSSCTTQEVFDRFASENEDFGFTKTVVPVRLARHGLEELVSRSQAKRLLARFDRFSTVVLDFSGIESVGQAFADEIFRVFRGDNPNVLIVPVHVGPQVQKMISRAEGNA
jgi:hypothetical protein